MAKILFYLCFMTSLFAQKGILIPFYHYPQIEDKEVQRLIEYKQRYSDVPLIVIINPNNGDFNRLEYNFASMIERLHEANISVVGYIYTSYAKRPLQEVEDRILAWAKMYKPFGVEGIFVDEVNGSERNLEYYRDISRNIAKHFDLTIFNPGVEAPALHSLANIVVTHENSSIHSLPSDGNSSALLLHSVKDLKRYRSYLKKYAYIYVTPHILPNPWEKLSPYLPQLLELFQSDKVSHKE